MDDYTFKDGAISAGKSVLRSTVDVVGSTYYSWVYIIAVGVYDAGYAVHSDKKEHNENKEFAIDLLELDKMGRVADRNNMTYVVVESNNEDVIPTTIDFYPNAFTEKTIDAYREILEEENLNYELPPLESVIEDYSSSYEVLKELEANNISTDTRLQRTSESIRTGGYE